MLLADTHAIIWFLEDSPKLSPRAKSEMVASIAAGVPILISAISIAEIIYLSEKSRISGSFLPRLLSELARADAGIRAVAFLPEMAAAMALIPREKIPDMPDRLIAATAVHLGASLISADAQIASAIATIW